MKGSKPRVDKNPVKGARERFEANSRLDRTYKIRRNRKLDMEIHKAAIALALSRGEVIEKKLVLKQKDQLAAKFLSKELGVNLFGSKPATNECCE